MCEQQERLTPREKDLMPLVCEGMSNQQIAEALGICEDTVKPGSSGNQTNLTSSAAITRIIDDIDYNHPVGENILYSSATYLPAYFPPGNWYHWDTIFGQYVSGSQYVQIGQSYPAYPSTRVQWYDQIWDNGGPHSQWGAIAANHGIVY
jgi:hypothetical protein